MEKKSGGPCAAMRGGGGAPGAAERGAPFWGVVGRWRSAKSGRGSSPSQKGKTGPVGRKNRKFGGEGKTGRTGVGFFGGPGEERTLLGKGERRRRGPFLGAGGKKRGGPGSPGALVPSGNGVERWGAGERAPTQARRPKERKGGNLSGGNWEGAKTPGGGSVFRMGGAPQGAQRGGGGDGARAADASVPGWGPSKRNEGGKKLNSPKILKPIISGLGENGWVFSGGGGGPLGGENGAGAPLVSCKSSGWPQRPAPKKGKRGGGKKGERGGKKKRRGGVERRRPKRRRRKEGEKREGDFDELGREGRRILGFLFIKLLIKVVV